MKTPRYTEQEMLAEIKKCAGEDGYAPTMHEFAEQANIHPQTIVKRFGSWNNAVRETGLKPRRNMNRTEMLTALVKLAEVLGQTPTGQDLDESDLTPNRVHYFRRFGSLEAAITEAGLVIKQVDEDQLRQTVVHQGKSLAASLGHLPNFNEWQDAHKTGRVTLSAWQVRRLWGGAGSWERLARDLD